jgi:hypothetical protein
MSKSNLIKDFSYPDPNDPDIQSKIYKKREFYYNAIPKREILKEYEDIQKYREAFCTYDYEPREQQIILPNLINPNTPYKGILLMHGVGTGKSMTAIRIAEQFKEQINKYNTKIYVLVPGPVTNENFKNQLLISTGNTYLKNKEILNQMSKHEINIENRNAIHNAMQFYKIMSYKKFYKKVLGEKRVEKKKIPGTDKLKLVHIKNEQGEYEREIVVDRILNMNNSILIVDEAHNITGHNNQYGEAVRTIIKNSENLRIILLTATPMINYADEIVNLLNFIRPSNDKISREKIFTTEINYKMSIKEGGLEYLKSKANGYISFYRGAIPYTFADRVEKGVIPPELLFTPITKCYMEEFQHNTYNRALEDIDDTLDRASSAVSNFVFPSLNKQTGELIGTYSGNGLITVLSQLNTDGPKLRSLINKNIFNNKLTKNEEDSFIYENDKKNITGLILKLPYIKYFSTKFYTIVNNLKNISGIAFIYSNLVKAGGIELFAETLIQNGYLEYQEDQNSYDIKDDTLDYKTGLSYSEYVNKNKDINLFKPATFLLITGGADETEDMPEIKQKIIQEEFNHTDNIDGKKIKFILGSRVLNEGVTLRNCKEVHIIDVWFNIPKIEQVIGRVIRMCVHQDVITDTYKFPAVNIYRYVIGLKKQLSTDELLYQKAELKYLTIKKIERALKEISIDCPLLLQNNMFPEELEKYKNCVYPTHENINAGKTICPALCDFQKCNLKCDAPTLNEKYWDTKKLVYNKLDHKDINYNTFNDDLNKYEIIIIKNKIKDLYRFKYVYIYDDIQTKIKESYLEHQIDFFESYFLDQALEELMPKTDNDFNNFKDTIYDKYNRPGYLIQRGIYYIFQPFNELENIPLYYRQHIEFNHTNQVSLNRYIKQYFKKKIKKETVSIKENIIQDNKYNFEDTLFYYDDRSEYDIVGIIDKNNNKLASSDIDLFKIRPSKNKNVTAKRGTGIPTFKGGVCSTAKDKKSLLELTNKILKLKDTDKLTREDICNKLKEKLLYLEKYSTTKDNNKMTYVIIPANHPTYPFPYNLEDRVKSNIKNITQILNEPYDYINVKKQKDKNDNTIYELLFKNKKNYNNIKNEIENLNFHLHDDIWIKILE